MNPSSTQPGRSSDAAPHASRASLIAIALLTLLALALRIYHIGQWSLWYDEGFTTYFGSLPLGKMFTELGKYESNPPGYYLIIHYWMQFFGRDEIHVRLFSAIFGAACVPALYILGRQLFTDRAALLAAAFLATCSYHVAYGQEARTYTLLMFASLVSMSLLLAMLERPTLGRQIAYVLVTALLPYLHIYGSLVILTQNLWYAMLLVFHRRGLSLRPVRWIALQFAMLLLLLPFLKIFFHNVHQVSQGFWIPRPQLWVLFQTPFEYSGWQFLIPDNWWQAGHSHHALTLVISVTAGIAAAILVFRRLRHSSSKIADPKHSPRFTRERRQPFTFLSLWIIVILIAPFVYSRIGVPMFVARYAMVSSCAIYLLAAAGLDAMIRQHRAAAFALVPIALLSALGLMKYYTEDSKPHWRDAAAYIDANAQPGDLVLISRPLILPVLFDYYSHRADLIKLGITDPRTPVTDQSADMILSPAAGHDRVWLIYHHDNDPGRYLLRHLQQTYTLQPTPFTGPGHWDITMYLFTRPAVAKATPPPTTLPRDRAAQADARD